VARQQRTRRIFSAEFKLEAVRRVEERRALGVSLTQIGRELDVQPDLLRAWQQQATARHDAPTPAVFPGKGKLSPQDEELRRLRRELEVVTQERDFLKRAAAFFARESR
jgi:transposase